MATAASQPTPGPNNDYLIPHSQVADRAFFQGIFSSVGQRLRALESTEAQYEAAIDTITTQALAIVTANITEEVDTQRVVLQQIREAADTIIAEVEAIQSTGIDATNVRVAPIAGLTGASVQAALADLLTKVAAKASGETLTTLGDRVTAVEEARSPFTFAYAFR